MDVFQPNPTFPNKATTLQEVQVRTPERTVIHKRNSDPKNSVKTVEVRAPAARKKNGQAQVVHTQGLQLIRRWRLPPNLLATRRLWTAALTRALHTRPEYRGLRFLRRSCACKTKNLPPSSLVVFRSPGAPASLRHEQ